MAQTFIGYPVIVAPGIQIATTGSSATGTIPLTSSGTAAKFIRISATAAACVRLFPPAGGNAANTDTQVQPGDSLILAVPDGMTKISAIQQAAAGVVQISALENS